MNNTLRNILAVVGGLIVGSFVNMGIISLGGQIIPPPEGADITTMEGLKASMHLMEPQHFLMPFLAHALGTLAGAVVASLIALKNKMLLAIVIGFFFLGGGIVNVVMLPSPVWFAVVDLVLAYIPMAWLGAKLTARN